MHQRGDAEAADQIDDERAVRKGATESLGGPEGDQVAGAGAGGPSEANPEESFHAVSPFFQAPRRG